MLESLHKKVNEIYSIHYKLNHFNCGSAHAEGNGDGMLLLKLYCLSVHDVLPRQILEGGGVRVGQCNPYFTYTIYQIKFGEIGELYQSSDFSIDN